MPAWCGVLTHHADKVRDAALVALTMIRVQTSGQADLPEAYEILVLRPKTAVSWSEVGRIRVEKSDAPPTTVRVVHEKRTAYQTAGSRSTFSRNQSPRMALVPAPMTEPAPPES